MAIRRVPGVCVALWMLAITGLAVTGLGMTGLAAEPAVFELGGARVEFSLAPALEGHPELRAGEDAIARLRVLDARTGTPLAGGRPRAWIARPPSGTQDEAACATQVRSLIAGTLVDQSAVNLNLYLILTLNNDRTITVINPQVGFAATKLETVIPLPGDGADWVLSANKRTLYVSLPAEGRIAIVDMVARRLARTVSTGDGSAPTRLALRPDGRQLWAGLDGTGEVAVIDTAEGSEVRHVPSGAGLHSIAFTADSRLAYVSNSGGDSVAVFDADAMTRRGEIAVPGTPIALAYGAKSRTVMVAALNAEAVTVIDTEQDRAVARLPARRGNVSIAFEPEGRYAFAVNQLDSTVAVIDSATGQMVSVLDVAKEPDQVTFSRGYAYVRGLQSETFSLINLREARGAGATSVQIQAGSVAPAALPQEIGPGRMIVPTPDGDSALIANGPEGAIYQYDEGMMATSGSFSNYKRAARALLILDRSLREVAPGEFSATVRLGTGGRFDVPVLLDQPRLTHCFEVTVAEPLEGTASRRRKPRLDPVAPSHNVAARHSETLLFRIIEADGESAAEGVPDLEVLAVRSPGAWRQRPRVEHVGSDLVRFSLAVPSAGQYQLVFSSPSLGLLGSLKLTATDPEVAATPTPSQ